MRRCFGVSMYNASRLARTEMARVQTEAQMHPHCFCSIAAATEGQIHQKENEDTYEFIDLAEFRKFPEHCKSILSELEFHFVEKAYL